MQMFCIFDYWSMQCSCVENHALVLANAISLSDLGQWYHTMESNCLKNRLHDVGLYAHRSVVCVSLIASRHAARREWTGEHVNRRRHEWRYTGCI